MCTTFDIDDSILKEIKRLQRREGESMGRLVRGIQTMDEVFSREALHALPSILLDKVGIYRVRSAPDVVSKVRLSQVSVEGDVLHITCTPLAVHGLASLNDTQLSEHGGSLFANEHYLAPKHGRWQIFMHPKVVDAVCEIVKPLLRGTTYRDDYNLIATPNHPRFVAIRKFGVVAQALFDYIGKQEMDEFRFAPDLLGGNAPNFAFIPRP